MQSMAVRSGEVPNRVYVIMRVHDITTRDIGHEVFVDPLGLGAEYVEFEAQGWYGYAVWP